jgi:long-chain acyl-CoA synthetase
MEEVGLPPALVEEYLRERVLDLDPGPGDATPVAEAAEMFAGLTPVRGSAVILALPSGASLLRHLFGVLYAGAVPVPVPAAMPAQRLAGLARRLGASLLVAPSGRSAPGVPVGGRGPVTVRALPGPWQGYGRGRVIILTSGTSGIHSGCLHRVAALLRNAGRHAASVGLRAGDTVLITLPLNFSYALVAQALAGLVTGARLVIAGPPFGAGAYLEAIARYGVTSSSLTPYLLRRLIPGPVPGGLRMLTVGGDALPAGEVGRLLRGRADLEVYLTYGLTEAGPRVSTLAAHREPVHRHASVGLPLPGVGVELRDVRDGVGELLVSSDTVLLRRVGEADGVAARDPLAPGRIATGDLFRLEEGYLYFAGRLGDSCLVDGVKVWLPSVRRLAMTLPGVVRAATRLCPGGPGDGEHAGHEGQRFVLELHMRDAGREAARSVRTELHRLLLRAERPCLIRALPVQETAYK